MATEGKCQLLITFVATPDKVGEIDRLVASHATWMAQTHHREGSKALLGYNFSMGPELANALDPGSEATGNTRYVLNEIYESPDGIADHWQQAQASWGDFPAMVEAIASYRLAHPDLKQLGTLIGSLGGDAG